MPELLTQFDPHLNQHVILSRTSPSSNYIKYIFNEQQNAFIKAPDVVKVIDLLPLHDSKCDRHGTIYFCENLKKNRRIFKYTFDSSSNEIHRVQCQCCEFDASRNGKWAYDGVEFPASYRYLPHAMNISRTFPIEPREAVDEHTSNFLWIQPYNSTTCMVTNDVVVFAMESQALKFDPSSQKFFPSNCECQRCSEAPSYYSKYNYFESQGIGFQRTHRDRNGAPLLALSITWKNEYEGVLDHFLDAQGHIGRYKYNYDSKCFDLEEVLDVRVQRSSLETRKCSEILYDDKLQVHYFSVCRQLGRQFFFGSHNKDNGVQKYTFNKLTHQFEIFHCNCNNCRYDKKIMMKNSRDTVVMSKCKVTGRRIQLISDKMGKIQKKILMEEEGEDRELEKAPIRDLTHWDENKLSTHYATLQNITIPIPPIQIFLPDGTEKWLTNGYHEEEFVLLMGMDGLVNPFKVENTRMGIKKYIQTDEFGVEIEKEKDKKNTEKKALLHPILPTDSELLSPQPCSSTIFISNYTYCTHYNNLLFFTTNNNHHLIPTKYQLIEVRCDECAERPQELGIVSRAHIGFDKGYAYQIDCRRDGNFVQKVAYCEDLKFWDLVMEFQVRLLKSRKDEDGNQALQSSNCSIPTTSTVFGTPESSVTLSEGFKDSQKDSLPSIIGKSKFIMTSSEDVKNSKEDSMDPESSFESDVSDEEESCEEDSEVEEPAEKSVSSESKLLADVKNRSSSDSEDDSDDESDSDVEKENLGILKTVFNESKLTSTPLKALSAPEYTENFKEISPEAKKDEDNNHEDPMEDPKDKTFTTIPLEESSDGEVPPEDHEDVDREYSRLERENVSVQLPESTWDGEPTAACTIS